MENIYVDPNVIDEKVCYKECPVSSVTTVKTSEKENSEKPKEQKDIQVTAKISESANANNQIGDNRKLERIYISGSGKPKVLPVIVGSEKDNIECIKFDIESAKRKEEIAEITPGWCDFPSLLVVKWKIMTPHNIIPGDDDVNHSIIYGDNFFMGGNVVFSDGNSHVENDEYDCSKNLENSNDEAFMNFSNEHDEVEKFSRLELSQKVAWELDSQFWNREESPYSFDPEDEKLESVDSNGELEYFIKWDGWDEKDNTWELSKNVFAQKLVNEYWNSLSIKKSDQKQLKSKKSYSSSTGLDEIKKRSKKRKPKNISSSDEERSEKVDISKPKKIKHKKQREKQPKLELDDIEPETSSDWERDIGDIESVEIKDERLVVFVAWNSGVRSMHYIEEVNKKAPQK
ncbi:21195_t:CDS:2, partial [Cetraspora pellucida]